MIVLYVLGYFNRNKQNSYAALNWRITPEYDGYTLAFEAGQLLTTFSHHNNCQYNLVNYPMFSLLGVDREFSTKH